ncbi:hypothetical protein [Puniceibacterium sp. IMCC21224]|uniref:hypothetical protein n=1 Tax=Puniceibacterium sp. IMCC21224 TaxID=1618204 RepID=UPI00064DE6C2|nr:hypothetical protein [Puniceibacterium sp. IMCC21224]KMK65824.1 hypothetical protein IMCC21224_11660 [Puniceibacterium sp. IMCC21224]
MTGFTLTKTRFQEGVWQGLLAAADAPCEPPEITVTLLDKPLHGVIVNRTPEAGRWLVEVPVPTEAIGDGAQIFVIRDAASDVVLNSFTLLSGEGLADDLRPEVDLLRAELDMLKRAFRRHCNEAG